MWTCLPCGEGRFIHLYESSATVLIAHSRLLRLISQAFSAFSRDFLCYWWLSRIPIKLQLTSKSCLILDFVVNVLEILVRYEKRLVGACVGFPLKNRERKEAGEYIRKKKWFEYLRQPFFSFFLLLLRWKRQSLKIIVWCVEGSYFQNEKDCTNNFESCLVIVWAIHVYDVIFEGCKWPVEEHKRIG